MKTVTIIKSNGSHWAGEDQDTISELLEVLSREPLDSTFERYGNFIYWLGGSNGFENPKSRANAKLQGMFNIWGNFRHVSHVFNIETNDRELIRSLGRAICANKRRGDYVRR